jgi:hypothetical protein
VVPQQLSHFSKEAGPIVGGDDYFLQHRTSVILRAPGRGP